MRLIFVRLGKQVFPDVTSLRRYARLVCTDDSPARLPPPVFNDFDPAVEIDLEPVDSVRITTLMDTSPTFSCPTKDQPDVSR